MIINLILLKEANRLRQLIRILFKKDKSHRSILGKEFKDLKRMCKILQYRSIQSQSAHFNQFKGISNQLKDRNLRKEPQFLRI
jgi:hypothetical protein